MARTLYSFTNKILWKNDLPSWRRVKKEAQQLGKEIGDLYKPTIPSPDMPRSPRQPRRRLDDNDAHIKQYRKLNMEQEKFAKLQQTVIKRFLISNKEIREMGQLKRAEYVQQLKQTKSVESLLHTERKLKAEIADRLRNEKRLTQEKNKQTLAQRRLTSSTEQMVGALASVYTGAAVGRAIITTGAQMEAIEKSFIIVSGGAEGAAEDLKFVRSEAKRLGAPFMTLAETFAKMRAAAGNKLGLEDLKDIFIGVNEAATGLGLNQEKVSKIMLATQQMLSKNKIMAEELK
ncbi:tape measure protein [Vibrio phage vB_VpaM_R16F]|nr:tape measure protein [Vibrio phage vB_VpaM_R16F]